MITTPDEKREGSLGAPTRHALDWRNPEFYAEVSRAQIEANTTIVANPWGRIQGIVRIGSKPASGVPIRYMSDRMSIRDVSYVKEEGETKADAKGCFVI